MYTLSSNLTGWFLRGALDGLVLFLHPVTAGASDFVSANDPTTMIDSIVFNSHTPLIVGGEFGNANHKKPQYCITLRHPDVDVEARMQRTAFNTWYFELSSPTKARLIDAVRATKHPEWQNVKIERQMQFSFPSAELADWLNKVTTYQQLGGLVWRESRSTKIRDTLGVRRGESVLCSTLPMEPEGAGQIKVAKIMDSNGWPRFAAWTLNFKAYAEALNDEGQYHNPAITKPEWKVRYFPKEPGH